MIWIILLFFILFIYSICCASARADELAEKMFQEYKSENLKNNKN